MRIGKIVRIWEVEPVEQPERVVPEPDQAPLEPAEPPPIEEPIETHTAARPPRHS